MKYHALFVNFGKAAKFEIVVCCKLIGGALWLKSNPCEHFRIFGIFFLSHTVDLQKFERYLPAKKS